MRRTWWLVLGWIGVGLFPNHARGQEWAGNPFVSAHVGASQWDLAGTGTSFSGAVRGGAYLSRVVVLEGSVTYFRPAQQGGGSESEKNSVITPELQFQFGIPGRISPYLGIGGGAAIESGRGNFQGSERIMASSSIGVRFAASDRIVIVPELRVRGIGRHFQGSVAEWTIGIGYVF